LIEIEDKNEWNSKVLKCTDYNFYQSFEWGQVKREQDWTVKRFYCEKNNGFSLCQCLGKKMLGINLVWLPGGPLLSDELEPSILSSLLGELTDYYERRNKLNYIRLNCQVKYSPELVEVFRKHDFLPPYYDMASSLTFVADRDYLKNIDKHLSSNWKHNLRRSCRNDFGISIKNNLEDIEEIYAIYEEAAKTKNFNRTISLQFLKEIHNSFRTVTFLVRNFSGRVILLYGNRAYDFLAGTTAHGRRNYSSYFLVYRLMQWCAENNIALFDFSGVDPRKVQGVYNFKKGTGAELVRFIGERERASPRLLRILCNLSIYLRGIGR